MSSEPSHPRQRTVAELLAEHGDAAPTGRRARRRASEGAASGAFPVVAPRPAPDVPAADPGPGGRVVDPGTPRVPAPVSGTPGVGVPAVGAAATVVPTATADAPTADVVPAGDARVPGAPVADGPGAAPVETTYRLPAAGRPSDAPPARRPVRDGPPAPGAPLGGPRTAAPAASPAGGRTSWRPGWSDGRPAAAAPPTGAPGGSPNGVAPSGNGGEGDRGTVYADTETVAYRPSAWPSSDRGRRAPGPGDIGRDQGDPGGEGRGRPTEHIPRLRSDRTTMLDPGRTGPIAVRLPRGDTDGGPSTAVGLAPPGAEEWHRERTSRRGPGPSPAAITDAGPGTGPPSGRDDGPPTEVTSPVDDDEQPGLTEPPVARRSNAPAIGSSGAGQAWAAVVAQWIAGAIGGAALWVGFRFLWRDLPVVAVAAAALVTVGLVLVVRALMHNDDRRTTLFAVLVGLLLTVSPAMLVLLGR